MRPSPAIGRWPAARRRSRPRPHPSPAPARHIIPGHSPHRPGGHARRSTVPRSWDPEVTGRLDTLTALDGAARPSRCGLEPGWYQPRWCEGRS
jgi:hypothetical protein